MFFSPDEAKFTLARVQDVLTKDEDSPQIKIRKMWLTLLAIRARALTNTARATFGDVVSNGPFMGMKLTDAAFTTYAAVLMGNYEQELHPVVERVVAKNYSRIINVGCSIGYYAVGLAMRMPGATIDAFDIDPVARTNCAEMAMLNNVGDRVRIGGLFQGEHFADYSDGRCLAFVDIEGGEMDLLDPERYPGLKKIDVVVELHDLFKPEISKSITERFAPTHNVEIITNQNQLPDVSKLLPQGQYIDLFDQALLAWEGRGGATPWGIFTVK